VNVLAANLLDQFPALYQNFLIGSLLDVLVTVELPSAYSDRPLLFLLVSPDSVALVSTSKYNRVDNQIQILKTVLFFKKKRFTADDTSFPSDSLVADDSLNFSHEVQESNCNVTALYILHES